MNEFLSILSDGSVTSAWLQGILIIFSTFVMEDLTTVGCGLLVAEGAIPLYHAFLPLWIGIALGDIGLYTVGRFLGPQLIRRGLLKVTYLRRTQRWFDRNLFLAVVISRTVPGIRVPAYLSAGVFRASPFRFLLFSIGTTLTWTVLLFGGAVLLGQRVLPLLGEYRWIAAAILLIAIVVGQRLIQKRFRADVSDETASREETQY